MTEPSCHCGHPKPYESCCGRFIEGGEDPPTAEELMRSRYSAFVAMDEDYLRATWHPDTRPSRVHLDPKVRWLGLTIEAVRAGGPDDREGIVEFVARCKRGVRRRRLHEISRFERIDRQWYYVDGKEGRA